jgi:TatA/E family protein of Tat protein translocase
MFGIGIQEMLLILLVVLLFFGPKRLPDLAKSLGKGLAEFKKASEEVKRSIDDAMKEEPAKEEAGKADSPAPDPLRPPEPPQSAAGPQEPSQQPPVSRG